MKKIILLFCAILFTQIFSFADELTDVQAFFDKYVSAANTYSKEIPNYYLNDAKIIRVVIKKDGTKQAVNFPMSDYKAQMSKSAKLAKIVGYKNNYRNVSVTKEGTDYKVSALRYPNKDTKGLSCYFIVTNTPNGYKIKVESMDTEVQDFLKYAK